MNNYIKLSGGYLPTCLYKIPNNDKYRKGLKKQNRNGRSAFEKVFRLVEVGSDHWYDLITVT